MSKYMGPAQIRGVEKLGDVMFPGGEGFPSFSGSGCARQMDRILDYMPAQDLKDLRLLLTLLAVLPVFLVRFFVWLLEVGSSWIILGAAIRTVRLGLRGLIMSLYYGTTEVLDQIGYEVSVYTQDR